MGILRKKDTANTGDKVKYDGTKTAPTRTRMGRWDTKAIGLPFFSIGVLPAEKINGSLMKAVWAEFVFTLLFIYMATGTICFGCHSSDVSTSSSGDSGGASITPVDCFLNSSRVLTIATSFGITIFAVVYASAAFSGGHLNPAVTMAFLLTKKLSIIRAFAYWFAQLAGAILGSYLVKYTDLTGFAAATGGANRLLMALPTSAGWLLETVLTFALVFVIFVATDSRRGQSTSHVPILAPAAIGFAVFACHLAAVALDGCSINPARSFGPAVTSGHWHNHWVFWAGPMSGAIIAALTYEFTFRPSHDPILTIDRHDDAGQGDVTAKLPGFTGASGLPSNDEAQDILKAKREDGHGNEETTGSGHIKKGAPDGHGHNVPNGHNTQNGHPNGNGRYANGVLDSHSVLLDGHSSSSGSSAERPGQWGGDPYSNLGPRMVGPHNV